MSVFSFSKKYSYLFLASILSLAFIPFKNANAEWMTVSSFSQMKNSCEYRLRHPLKSTITNTASSSNLYLTASVSLFSSNYNASTGISTQHVSLDVPLDLLQISNLKYRGVLSTDNYDKITYVYKTNHPDYRPLNTSIRYFIRQDNFRSADAIVNVFSMKDNWVIPQGYPLSVDKLILEQNCK